MSGLPTQGELLRTRVAREELVRLLLDDPRLIEIRLEVRDSRRRASKILGWPQAKKWRALIADEASFLQWFESHSDQVRAVEEKANGIFLQGLVNLGLPSSWAWLVPALKDGLSPPIDRQREAEWLAREFDDRLAAAGVDRAERDREVERYRSILADLPAQPPGISDLEDVDAPKWKTEAPSIPPFEPFAGSSPSGMHRWIDTWARRAHWLVDRETLALEPGRGPAHGGETTRRHVQWYYRAKIKEPPDSTAAIAKDEYPEPTAESQRAILSGINAAIDALAREIPKP